MMECSIPNDRTLNGGPLVVSLRRNVIVSMAPFDADAKSYLLGDNHTNVEFVILGWLSAAGIKIIKIEFEGGDDRRRWDMAGA